MAAYGDSYVVFKTKRIYGHCHSSLTTIFKHRENDGLRTKERGERERATKAISAAEEALLRASDGDSFCAKAVL